MTAAERPPHNQPNRRNGPEPLIAVPDDDGTFTFRPAPVREPPFDDERDPIALDLPWPTQPELPFPATHPPVRHRPAVAPRSARRAAVGDPARVAHRLLVGIIEVAAQRRPLTQLAAIVTPSVAVALRTDLAPERRTPHRLQAATVTSMRSSEPADGVAELCATLRTPRKVHAAALRLEIRRGQWICTRLMIG